MATRILVVEDEPAIAQLLRMTLEREGHAVRIASSVREARQAFVQGPWDLLLLDVMLPDGSGFDICREVRVLSQVPVLMVTARGEDPDKIQGLELGADDYITKPFNPRELQARIRAILRRAPVASPSPVLEAGGLVLDLQNRTLHQDDRTVSLTPKEFELLHFFMSHPGQVFTRDDLLDRVWGKGFFGDHKTVDVHVRRLREKTEPDPRHPLRIVTIWGTGYKFQESPPPS